LAVTTLANKLFEIYEQGSVTIDTVKDFGFFLLVLSIALFPEFFSSKASKAFKVDGKSKREKISEQLLSGGFFLIAIGVVIDIAL